MSETSEDKSKRKYLKLLNDYEWNYQHSLFYENPEDSKLLLDDMIRFKQFSRRRCADHALLIRVQLLRKKTAYNPNGTEQAYLTILATKDIKASIQEAAKTTISSPCNVVIKQLSAEKKNSIASAIKSQKPHNLERFFGKEKINRFTVLNRDKAKKKQDTKQEENPTNCNQDKPSKH